MKALVFKTFGGQKYSNIAKSRVARSNELFRWMEEGKVTVSKPTAYALSEGQGAYRYLESRKSTGKILLIP